MNLNLNPEQFLTIYGTVSNSSHPVAQEIKEKMTSVLLDALASIDDEKNKDKFVHWLKQEQNRVSEMNDELKSIKPVVSTKKKKGK